MKKSLFAVAFVLLSGFARASTTAVTATPLDAQSRICAACNWTASLTDFSGSPTAGGSVFSHGVSGITDAGGLISTAVTDNSTVSQAGTHWVFGICIPDGSACFTTAPLTISGASLDITASLNSVVQFFQRAAIGRTVIPTVNHPFKINPYAASGTLDISTGSFQYMLLSGNFTLSGISNGVQGDYLFMAFQQDATGSRVITWPASLKWPLGVPLVLNTAANSYSTAAFIFDGANWINLGSSLGVR